ncbi:MAG TPA: ATP-dependent DNA helicase [bacterium]|nr:ATP-dependent DNA helicase [bacterium]
MAELLLDHLNTSQKQAVTHAEGPILVIAGAGTGKTRVITTRIAYLIEQGLARPDEILALTFTDKAAEEMANRVDELMPLGYSEMQISTFHRFCDRLLRERGLDIGLNTDFTILSKAEQWLLLKEHLFEFDLEYYRPLGNPYRFIDALLTHFSRAKDEIVTPAEYLEYAKWRATEGGIEIQNSKYKMQNAKLDAEQEEAIKTWEVANAYVKYQELLVADPKQTRLDFGDLILYALQLLREHPSVCAQYQKTFSYVLVDEFQDTNYAQNELVKLIAGERKNIMVVGDDDQSIYRFRGAAVSNIMQFQEDFPEAATVVLTENYRSTQSILDCSYRLIQNNNPDRLEVKAKVDKKLQSTNGIGREPEIIHAAGLDEETELVARKILDLHGTPFVDAEAVTASAPSHEQMDLFGSLSASSDPVMTAAAVATPPQQLKWSDFAILARANSHLEPFIQTLRYHGIPFQLVGSRGLYVREEIKDLIAYLRVLVDPDDSLSLYRLLSLELFQQNPKDVLILLKWARRQNKSLYDACADVDQLRLSKATVERLGWLREQVSRDQARILTANPGQILRDFVREIKLYEALTETETIENVTKILNINLFFQEIKQYLTDHADRTTAGFVRYLDLMIEAGDNPATAEVDSRSDAVHLMTIHAAKGLEFAGVFLVNLVDSRFPTRRRGDPLPLPEQFIKESLPEGDEHLQEERRLFYVGMTRAKKHLYLCYADNYGGVRERKPSLFISEALGEATVSTTPVDAFAQPEKRESATGTVDLKPFLPRLYSYSQLQMFEKCPLQYKYAYIYRIPTAPNRSLVFGQAVHRTLKDFYDGLAKGLERTEEALLELFGRNWQREGFDCDAEVEEQYRRGQDVLRAYYAANQKQLAPAAFLEKDFILKAGQYAVTGYIDRIDRLPDGTYEVIDYKTGTSKSEAELEKTVAKDDQLSIYALACRDVLHLDVSRLTLYYIEDGWKKSSTRTPAQLEIMESQIVETASKIQRSDFPPAPGEFTCRFCSYHELCPFSAV